jgi:predicted acyl esterase
LWRAVVVEHPLRDAWWDDRNILDLLDRVECPVYLGCDWQNVPLHLPSTFPPIKKLTNSKHVRVTMMGEHGLAWPWESLHVEALAWFDQWLKGKETGILDGPRIRYVIPEAEGWHASDIWPIPGAKLQAYSLHSDGRLSADETGDGSRIYMNLGSGLGRPGPSEIDPPSFLVWDSAPLDEDLDIAGPIELQLDASCTAPDTAFIAILQDVNASGKETEVTAGFLRAGLRAVNEAASEPGAPVLDCRSFEAVPVGEVVHYRIPIVPNARRFKAGHRLRLYLTSDDQDKDKPSLMGFRHASIGTSSINTILSSSRLLLPVCKT